VHLDAQDSDALTRWLRAKRWIGEHEAVTALASAGPGNMNLTLRAHLGDRTFIVKQSRAWVEKYPDIAAPPDRALSEAAFYEAVAGYEAVASAMPTLLHVDREARVLVLEDLGAAADCNDVYGGVALGEGAREELLRWLGALHAIALPAPPPVLRNRAMRALNHEHVFDLPLRPDTFDADDFCAGLEEHAAALRADEEYVAATDELGALYQGDGDTLLHGDFYPGSWLRTAAGLRVIDPEFCFLGPAEFDVGVMLAHAVLAGGDPGAEEAAIAASYVGPEGFDFALVRQFAGVEIMRRLIGVAQLPLDASLERRGGVASRLPRTGPRMIGRGRARLLVALAVALGACVGGPPDAAALADALAADVADAPATAPLPVWIDADVAAGVPRRDIDDAVALVQAFGSPELAIRGVSVVFGNTSLELAVPIAREVVSSFGPAGLEVHAGAAGPEQRGTPTDGSTALIAALEAEPLTLLVLGPATNVATVLELRPDLAPRIVELVAVAGRRPGQRFTTGTTNPRGHRDFNFEQDAEAFATILAHDVPLTLAPWEISSTVWITDTELSRWAAGGPAGAWLAAAAPSWIGLWKEEFEVDGFNPFDTLAVAVVTSPDLIDCERLPVHVVRGPNDVTAEATQGSAAVETKPYLVVNSTAATARLARYCHTAAPAFLEDLMRRLGASAP